MGVRKLLIFFVFFGFGFSVTNAQLISTIAGNGVYGFTGDGGPATAAEVYPEGVTTDGQGNIYFSTGEEFYSGMNAWGYYTVRMVNTSEIISTIAGLDTSGYSGDGGPATAAELDGTTGVTSDASGNLYLADAGNNVIRMINTSGIISTCAGNGYGAGFYGAGFSGDGGPATAAELYRPMWVTIDQAGNLYIADSYNQRIRKVNTNGIISTIAGNGYTTLGPMFGSYSGDGGPATAAELNYPQGVGVDAFGNVYISDNGNDRVRKVGTDGVINTFAGVGIGSLSGYNVTGVPATATAISPVTIAVNPAGEVFISDGDDCIRKVDLSGIITTVAGKAFSGYSGDGGAATAAEINGPYGIALDISNNIFFSDGSNYRIRKVTSGFLTLMGQDSSSNCNICNGVAFSFPEGGTPPYTYLWSPGGNTASSLTGVCPGIYNVNVHDASGDTLNSESIIVRSTILKDSTGNECATCCDCRGQAWIYMYGGSPPYTYSWSNGNTTSFISGLPHGTYTVKVTDSSGCSLVDTVHVSSGPHVTSVSASNSCYSGNNGTATATGGTNYLWTPTGQTTATATGLSAGVYTVTIINNDSVGCPAAALTVTIGQPSPIAVSCYAVNAGPCFGGVLSSTVAGGTPPYYYSWNPSYYCGTCSTEQIPVGCNTVLDGGDNFTITVTDANGCTASSQLQYPEGPVEWVTDSSRATNVTCYGANDGTIYVQACVGNAGCSDCSFDNGFELNPGGISGGYYAGSYTFTNLAAGSYTVTMPGSCAGALYFTITQPTKLGVSTAFTINVSCNGGDNGGASSSVTGGTLPYTYLWSDANSQTNFIATGLSAGYYVIRVTDNNGCIATQLATITQPPPLSIAADSINATNGNCNGTAWAIVNGGTNPYTYLWTGGLTTDTISNQCVNYYCCTITDANGCIDSACINIETSTGTGQLTIDNGGLTIYPNPNNGKFTLAFSYAELVSASQTIIKVYNVLGEQIYLGMPNPPVGGQHDYLMDLSSQPDGMYFYRVLRENGSLVGEGKVVIEK